MCFIVNEYFLLIFTFLVLKGLGPEIFHVLAVFKFESC